MDGRYELLKLMKNGHIEATHSTNDGKAKFSALRKEVTSSRIMILRHAKPSAVILRIADFKALLKKAEAFDRAQSGRDNNV